MDRQLISELSSAHKFRIREGVLGKTVTTFCIGGPLRCLFEPNSQEELAAILKAAQDSGIECKILGAGSNLLISDHGVSAWVVRLGRAFRFCNPLGEGRFEVGAASSLMSLSREFAAQGFQGLEFAGGIPASLGGAIRMNAGAHGGQIWDCLESIKFLDPEAGVQEAAISQFTYSYRECSLPIGAIVLSAVLQLSAAQAAQCTALRARYLAERKERQPLTMPCAGSVFKNPRADLSAGMLIERAGLKGYAHGGAEISTKHGNWIVNPQREAKATDVQVLVDLCVKKVEQESGINLVREIIYW